MKTNLLILAVASLSTTGAAHAALTDVVARVAATGTETAPFKAPPLAGQGMLQLAEVDMQEQNQHGSDDDDGPDHDANDDHGDDDRDDDHGDDDDDGRDGDDGDDGDDGNGGESHGSGEGESGDDGEGSGEGESGDD